MNQERLTGIFILLIGLAVFFLLIPVGIVSPSNVDQIALSPDFWPRIVAGIIAVMGVLMIIKPAPENGSEPDPIVLPNRISGLLLCLVSLFGFYFLIPHLGMVASGMLIIPGLMIFAGERRWLLILTLSVLTPLLLYFFFVHVANVPMPLGYFEFLRG